MNDCMNIMFNLKYTKAASFIIVFVFACGFALGQNKGGRWQFENNGNDSCSWNSNNHVGLLSGSAAFSTLEPLAEGNYYLSLENENNYGTFRLSDNNDLDFRNESLAISLWVYPVEANGNPQFLLIKGDRAGNSKTDNYSLRLTSTENESSLEFLTHLESGTLRSVTSSFIVPPNQWSFIAVYYDYQNSKIYLWNDEKAAPVDTFNFTADLFPNDDSLFIGASGKNGFKRFWGRIDDVRIGSNINQILFDVTGVESLNQIHPAVSFKLNQNFPNPFNPETTIRFSLNDNGFTNLEVYNLLGQHVADLLNGEVSAGEHKIIFNAENLPSGVYLYKLQQGSHSEIKKMLLLK